MVISLYCEMFLRGETFQTLINIVSGEEKSNVYTGKKGYKMKTNYLIVYTALDKSGQVIRKGTMRAKNKLSGLDAQIKLEMYLSKKYSNFAKMIVHDCMEENPFKTIFGDIM